MRKEPVEISLKLLHHDALEGREGGEKVYPQIAPIFTDFLQDPCGEKNCPQMAQMNADDEQTLVAAFVFRGVH